MSGQGFVNFLAGATGKRAHTCQRHSQPQDTTPGWMTKVAALAERGVVEFLSYSTQDLNASTGPQSKTKALLFSMRNDRALARCQWRCSQLLESRVAAETFKRTIDPARTAANAKSRKSVPNATLQQLVTMVRDDFGFLRCVDFDTSKSNQARIGLARK